MRLRDLTERFPTRRAGFLGLVRSATRQRLRDLVLVRGKRFLPLIPNHVAFLDSKASALLALDRFDEAEAVYGELVERFSTRPAGFLGLVRSAARQKQHDLVLERCEKFMPLFPDEVPLLNSKGFALLARERFDEAEAAYGEIAERFPTLPAGFVGLVHSAAGQKQHDLVLELCEKFMPLFPDEAPLLNSKGFALLAHERFDEAEAVYGELAERFSTRPAGFLGLVRSAARQKQHDLVLERCEKFMPLFPDEVELLNSKAAALWALGRFDEAEAVYGELAERFPTRPAGFLGLVRSAAGHKQHDLVLERCEKFMPLFPDEVELLQNKAAALWALERFDEAVRMCRDLIRQCRSEELAYLTLARIALARAEYDEALGYSNRAIELEPSVIANYIVKGDALLNLFRLPEAREHFDRMVTDIPESEAGHVGLLQLFTKLGDHASALSAIEKAYEMQPTNRTVVGLYAATLERQGQVDRAYRLLEHHIRDFRDDFCIPLVVGLYSKYGETSKILEMMGRESAFFASDPDLQNMAGLALRNRGNLAGAYDVFESYLVQEVNPTLKNLKQRFWAYEQISLLHEITKNPQLFKHYRLRDQHLPKPSSTRAAPINAPSICSPKATTWRPRNRLHNSCQKTRMTTSPGSTA